MKLESSIALVEKPIEEVFNQLSKASAYERLMPEEASFHLKDEEHFSFKLGGMPTISLKLAQKIPVRQIVLAADSGNIPFELYANFSENSGQTQVQLVFEGTINPMMQMMVKKPLTQFLEALIGNLKQL